MKTRSAEEMIDHLIANSIKDENGCILWLGCVAGKGYGVVCWQGHQVYIHRLAYQLEHPDETIDVIRHSCDVPNCWNMDHLHNGTTQDNIDDMIAKGRHHHGETTHNSVLTDDLVRYIRASTLTGTRLAIELNIDPATISYARRGKTWTHVQ